MRSAGCSIFDLGVQFGSNKRSHAAGNPRTLAVKAVAEYEGVELKYVDVGNIFDKASLPKDFVQKFPQTKVRQHQ